jgi:hypothetical protein
LSTEAVHRRGKQVRDEAKTDDVPPVGKFQNEKVKKRNIRGPQDRPNEETGSGEKNKIHQIHLRRCFRAVPAAGGFSMWCTLI